MPKDQMRPRNTASSNSDALSGDTTTSWFNDSVLTVLGWIGSVPDHAVSQALTLLCDLQTAVGTRGGRRHAAA